MFSFASPVVCALRGTLQPLDARSSEKSHLSARAAEPYVTAGARAAQTCVRMRLSFHVELRVTARGVRGRTGPGRWRPRSARRKLSGRIVMGPGSGRKSSTATRVSSATGHRFCGPFAARCFECVAPVRLPARNVVKRALARPSSSTTSLRRSSAFAPATGLPSTYHSVRYVLSCAHVQLVAACPWRRPPRPFYCFAAAAPASPLLICVGSDGWLGGIASSLCTPREGRSAR